MHLQLIVGLQNYKPEFSKTRHNAGAWFLEALVQTYHVQLKFNRSCHGFVTVLSQYNPPCYGLLPKTFMNESGRAIQSMMHYYQINAEHMLIAHDDLDLSVGQVRLKLDGGHGGHNGLRDVMQQLHSSNFYRLRIGIGHPGHRHLVHDYVLSKPTLTEKQRIDAGIQMALSVFPFILQGEWEKAVQILHTIKD